MTRTYGRSHSGSRVVAKVPHGRWETTTFVGAMRVTGFVAPLCVDGAINGRVFRAWVEQHLIKVLRPGDIVVMDNLSSHKIGGVVEAIESVGAEVRYLPPYSPDLAPNDFFLFPKLKQVIKGTRFTDEEAIKRAMSYRESFQECMQAWRRRMEKCV